MSLLKLDIDNNFKGGSTGLKLQEASGAIKSDQNSRWPVSDTFSARRLEVCESKNRFQISIDGMYSGARFCPLGQNLTKIFFQKVHEGINFGAG